MTFPSLLSTKAPRPLAVDAREEVQKDEGQRREPGKFLGESHLTDAADSSRSRAQQNIQQTKQRQASTGPVPARKDAQNGPLAVSSLVSVFLSFYKLLSSSQILFRKSARITCDFSAYYVKTARYCEPTSTARTPSGCLRVQRWFKTIARCPLVQHVWRQMLVT